MLVLLNPYRFSNSISSVLLGKKKAAMKANPLIDSKQMAGTGLYSSAINGEKIVRVLAMKLQIPVAVALF